MTRAQRAPLVDRYGRVASDLRISLTDRCNLRCTYCMPAEGLEWLPTKLTLSDDEIHRLARIAVTMLGVRRIRLTGGEPLLRASLVDIVATLKTLRDEDGKPPELSITTNALGLQHRAAALREAGLDRVNISLDSLDRQRYAASARRDRLDDVLRGLRAAQNAGFDPIKINAVPLPASFREDAPALLAYALEHGHQLRFIEHMPLGPIGSWKRDDVVTQEDLLTAITDAGFDLSPNPARRGSAPAELFDVAPGRHHGAGTVGIVASVSAPFCGACSRTRLTADGQVRSCLFSRTETDLRTPLRDGATDETLADLWREAMWGKPRAHGIDEGEFATPSRTMSAIGG